LGGKLKKRPESVGIFGTQYNVRAQIAIIDSMSAHADYEDLSQWLSCQHKEDVKKVFLVHGEYDVQIRFRDRLVRKGFLDVEIPALHQEIGLGI
ncbi:MAG: MBL fold metallo-hydrolase, partial [Chitinophagaceae bacterium]|nr:MBL fold metallo-hydrolase [Chitinophagaceae bacterium]